jgi:hypothetical protein
VNNKECSMACFEESLRQGRSRESAQTWYGFEDRAIFDYRKVWHRKCRKDIEGNASQIQFVL